MVSERAARLAQRVFGGAAPLARSLDELQALPPGPAVLALPNARSASRLLAALFGEPSPVAPGEAQVQDALRARGLRVRAREELIEPAPQQPHPLLCELLHALQPASRADVLLYAVEPGQPAPAARPLRAGLLSVAVRWDGADADALDRTLFACACQRLRPFELIVAAPAEALPGARLALARHAHLGTFEGRAIEAPPGLARGWAAAAQAASGQHFAVLDAGDLVYPDHFARLSQALRGAGAGLAVARGRTTRSDAPGHIADKLVAPRGALDVATFLRERALRPPALLFDRARLPEEAVNNPDPDGSDPDGTLSLRLAGAAAFAAVEEVTWERPERPLPPQDKVERMPLLTTLRELQAMVARAPAPPWLRYRVADAVSAALHKVLSLRRRP
jgi:hypothetical protein